MRCCGTAADCNTKGVDQAPAHAKQHACFKEVQQQLLETSAISLSNQLQPSRIDFTKNTERILQESHMTPLPCSLAPANMIVVLTEPQASPAPLHSTTVT
jgi:hypothetical protein